MNCICLPHAGGSARTFAGWKRRLPNGIHILPVDYPGHGRRMSEPLAYCMDDLVRSLLATHSAEWDRAPFALFGHSLGGIVAFELACQIVQRGGRAPLHLFISAARPPGERVAPQLHQLPSEEFSSAIARLDPAQAEALAEPELMTVLEPILRADLKIAETWLPRTGMCLAIPATILTGRDDPLVSPEGQDRWSAHFQTAVRWQTFEGGHFYFRSDPTMVINEVAQTLAVEKKLVNEI